VYVSCDDCPERGEGLDTHAGGAGDGAAHIPDAASLSLSLDSRHAKTDKAANAAAANL
jgi:hypothetical protein